MKLVSYVDAKLAAATVAPDLSLRATMDVMSRNGLRLVPVAAEDGALLGVAADGDLRRFIARGGRLEDPVRDAMNTRPTVLTETASTAEIRAMMMRRSIEAMPQVINGRLTALHVLKVAAGADDLTAVLMAGGLGSRLAPLTDTCPKPLLAMGGKPILTHIIEHLRDQGVSRFIISVNYLADMIVNHYGDGAALDVSIDYVYETQRLGTGGALSLIDPQSLSEPFFVLNGDILNDVDLAALRDTHDAAGWDATMVVREHGYTIPYGVVRRDAEGAFEGAEEKPTMHYCINAGIYLLNKATLGLIPQNSFYDLPTLFGALRDAGLRGGTYSHQGRWIDIGNVADFNRARAIFEGENE